MVAETGFGQPMTFGVLVTTAPLCKMHMYVHKRSSVLSTVGPTCLFLCLFNVGQFPFLMVCALIGAHCDFVNALCPDPRSKDQEPARERNTHRNMHRRTYQVRVLGLLAWVRNNRN